MPLRFFMAGLRPVRLHFDEKGQPRLAEGWDWNARAMKPDNELLLECLFGHDTQEIDSVSFEQAVKRLKKEPVRG